MQTASNAFAIAASGASVTWADPQVYADWAGDGYGAQGSIDDLSGLVGQITISHALDDGFPDEVTLIGEPSPATASAPLSAPDGTSPSRYWSAYNASSPMYGYARDIAPTTIDAGIITTDGPEQVRVFTGQLADVPVKTGTADLKLISAARMNMAKLVQPPVVSGEYGLCNATWLISWLLYQCGYELGPQPQDGCVFWAPMHGSPHPVIGTASPGTFTAALDYPDLLPITWSTGPYVLAPDLTPTIGASLRLGGTIDGPDLADGDDLLSQAGAIGRIQFWVKGVAADLNSPGGGYDLVDFFASNGLGSVHVGIDDADRKLFITANDGAKSLTHKAAAALPSDDAWYFCGAAWDFSANKVWTNFNGTVASSGASPAFVTSNLPANQDDMVFGYTAFLPFAELQVNSGSTASPTTNPTWANGTTWASGGAIVYPSGLSLSVICEPVPREAWELFGAIAKSELAMVRSDEQDRPCYLPRGYFAQIDQQQIVDAIDTDRDISELDVAADPVKIRNSVRVEYQERWLETVPTPLLQLRTPLTLPRGTTTVTLPLDAGGYVPNGDITPMSAGTIAAGGLGDGVSAMSVNVDPSGLLTYTITQVTASVVGSTAGTVTVEFVNSSNTVWYVANDSSSVPFLSIAGYAVVGLTSAVSESEAVSVAARGERALTVSDVEMVHNRSDATHLARQLVLELCRPIGVASQVKTFADPRRQPGDHVTLTDSADQGIGGTWQLMQVEHSIDGADYQQTIAAREAVMVGTWGTSRWGQSRWGPNA